MVIELKNIFANYGKKTILKDISYTFKAGLFYGIFGPNGCGKSTLSKIISKELLPKTGIVNVPWKNSYNRAKLLAVADQSVPVTLPLKVREIVQLGTYPWERDTNRYLLTKIVEDSLQLFDLQDLANSNYSTLSGGQKQLVMLCKVLAQNTPIILLDEPASSLDVGARHKLCQILKKVAQKEQKCIIMISHDPFIVPAYLDEAILMEDGKIKYFGHPQDVLQEQHLKEVFNY
jgi:iron complex transport system ATP-binding protein